MVRIKRSEAATGQAVEPPTKEELKKVISELKNGKTFAADILPELLKAGSEQLHDAIHRIILRIWMDEQMPEDWLENLIRSIHKKAHRFGCSN